jgi:hypothetical protein
VISILRRCYLVSEVEKRDRGLTPVVSLLTMVITTGSFARGYERLDRHLRFIRGQAMVDLWQGCEGREKRNVRSWGKGWYRWPTLRFSFLVSSSVQDR